MSRPRTKTLVSLLAFTPILLAIIAVTPEKAQGEDQKPIVLTSNGTCMPASLADVSVASPPITEPLVPWRVTGVFNNSSPYIDNKGNGHRGHNGIDLGGEYAGAVHGKEKIHSAFAGVVIATSSGTGWGNSIAIASRVSPHSREIITTHYHHLAERYVAIEKNGDATGICPQVLKGDLLGMEGGTGTHEKEFLAHLHFTVRYWADLEHLNNWLSSGDNGSRVFGSGYPGYNSPSLRGRRYPADAFDSKSPYAYYGYLNPATLTKDYFEDFAGEDPPHGWSAPYAKKMRRYGITLGNWDGKFGAGELVKRREAARWLRIAIGNKLQTNASFGPQFVDVPYDDPDRRYIEDLTTYPSPSVINPLRVCTGGQVSFCPDANLNRAEALKMVVLSFYGDEFNGFWSSNFWSTFANNSSVAALLDVEPLDLFSDVDISSDWFAPYVYFGVSRGIVALQEQFLPGNPVVRAEMAKWVVLGYEKNNAPAEGPCDSVICPADQHCDESAMSCVTSATCVPTEEKPCEVGGGAGATCGDGSCNGNEACDTCAADCGTCPPGCPDGVCDNGETCNSCPQDCGPCGDVCGDDQCTGGENCQSCPGDCGACPLGCPDGACNNGETCNSCPQDCGVCPPVCGDNQCNGNETCNTCSDDCGNCICANNEVDAQACNPGTYCPPGTQERVCNNDSWGPWGACEANSGLKFYGDGGKHCGPVVCLQISPVGNDSALTATISKADNSAFANDISLTVWQPSTNLTAFYGCLPTSGKTSHNISISPGNFTISLGSTTWMEAHVFSPCANGGDYNSGQAAISQCSSN